MKKTEIIPGVRASTKIGQYRQIVTIQGWSEAAKHGTRDRGSRDVLVRTKAGNVIYRSPGQLKALPVKQDGLQVETASSGQTIDLGDVVITTTLHRIG